MHKAKLAGALVVALGLSGAGVAGAADLGPAGVESSMPVDDSLVEFGTGWYLRGDAGAVKDLQGELAGDLPSLPSRVGWTFDAGFGYRFNNWFRSDITFGMDQPQTSKLAPSAATICPYTLQGLTTQGDKPIQIGYLWSAQAGTCTGAGSATLYQGDVLVNGYVDLGTWYGLTPYVGAGIGASELRTTGTYNYYKTSDGTVYNTDLTPTGTYPLIWTDVYGRPISPQPLKPGTANPVAFGKQDWSRSLKQTNTNFAWALMGGFAYSLTDHTSIDIGYRYVNRGSYKSALGGSDKTWSTQAVRVGFRYMID